MRASRRRRGARLRQREQQMPALRPGTDAPRQILPQHVRIAGLRAFARIGHPLRRDAPAHRLPPSRRIDEIERVQAVIRLGDVARARLRRLHPCAKRSRLRMRVEERLQLRRIGLARPRIGPARHRLFVERARRRHRKHRHAVHPRAPLLAVRRAQAQREAADRHAAIRRVRIAARQREAPNHRRAHRREKGCGRIRARRAVAFEITRHAYAFRVIAPVARMQAAIALQRVDEPLWRQPMRREPAADVAERRRDRRHRAADQRPSPEAARRPVARWC